VGRASGGFLLVSPFPPPLLEWHSGWDTWNKKLRFKLYLYLIHFFKDSIEKGPVLRYLQKSQAYNSGFMENIIPHK
jgi:hypothetical protein